MKKQVLLFTTVAGIAIISLTSSNSGAGNGSGFNCTGAETGNSNGAGCSKAGNSCHSTAATAGIQIVLELDSSGSSVTHYTPGITYTLKITGTNTTSATLPKFGFQAACIKGSAAVATPINAGTWGTVSGNLRNTPAISGDFVCNVVEHSSPIPATTLGGATGGTYVVSFLWTAPAIGTGSVSLWSTLNAVNGDGSATNADVWNTTHLVLTETDPTTGVGLTHGTNNISINAFPNPVSNILNLQFGNGQKGNYSIQAFDLSGKCVANENIELNNNQVASLNTANWAPGMYQVVIRNGGVTQIVRVVKNL